MLFRELSDETKRDFQLVTVLHVLEHVPRPLELLSQLYDYIRDGGIIVVEVPSAERSALGLPHIYFFEPIVIERLIRLAGFRIVSSHHTPHTVIVARKPKRVDYYE